MAIDVSWHSYPPDVPVEERMPCASPGCGRPGEIVETRMPTTGRLLLLGSRGSTTTVWCLDDARQHGYDDTPTETPPAHLNAFQRWIVNALGGDKSEAGPE